MCVCVCENYFSEKKELKTDKEKKTRKFSIERKQHFYELKKRKEKKKRERGSFYTCRQCTLHKKEKEEKETSSKNRTVINMNIFS